MMVRLVHEFRFEAAHKLPRVPEGHKCARLHGHSFKVELAIRGPVDERTGWFIDYASSTRPGSRSSPSSTTTTSRRRGAAEPHHENLARWIWETHAAQVASLVRVTIFETCDARGEYEGD